MFGFDNATYPHINRAERNINWQLQFLTFECLNTYMKISGSDIHLLSVFDSVVRNNGFSAAQTELGLSQPTISNHITALEQRIGVKLCQRGRRGFLLTEKGQMVHDIAKSLMTNLDEQSAQLSALKGGLVGSIKLAVVDSLATDPNLKLPEAIRAMTQHAPSVRISIELKQPQDILNGIANGNFHIGIGSFDNRLDGLRYEDLYAETHSVYCSASHPVLVAESGSDAIYDYPWVHRGYWGRQRQRRIKPHELDREVRDIEAQALLVLSGQYLGLLPDHAAHSHVAYGRLSAIPQASENYSCIMQMITRSAPQPRTVELFRNLLASEYAIA